MTESLVVCKDLGHTYPAGVTALHDINLTISDGEVVGIIGQNGSGKTTLVKHFNGLLKPTEGQVTVCGLDVVTHGIHELSRLVGYAFQNPNHQLFAKTVEEELAFGPINLGLDQEVVRERVERTIEFFGLEGFRTTHPYRLSLPIRKMVAVAAVYAMQPKIFILDEPTTGQDHIGVNMVRRLIDHLRTVGATIVIVSHDMILQAEATDRLIVLWQGEMIGDGSNREVLSDIRLLEKTNLHAPQITQLSQHLNVPSLPKTALSVNELSEPLIEILQSRFG